MKILRKIPFNEEILARFKSKLLNKELSRFSLVWDVFFCSLVTLTALLAAGFIVFTMPELEGKQLIFWGALISAAAQLIVIWYLYYSRSVYAFVRNAIYFVIMMSNFWLCLLMFSLAT